MSKSKNIKFIALVTIFCIVTAYFSVLSPTTAYFVDKQNKDVNVSFSLLSTQDTISDTPVDFNLKGATKFEDFGELLFDDVVYGQFVSVSNVGEIPAKVYLEVSIPTESADNGLKYIVIPTEVGTSVPSFTVPTGADTFKGDIKELVETRLHSFRNDFVDGVSLSTALEILNAYNSRVKSFSTAPLLDVGESVGFQVYFWAEYGNLEGTINDTSTISSFDFSARVIIKARQNLAEAA